MRSRFLGISHKGTHSSTELSYSLSNGRKWGLPTVYCPACGKVSGQTAVCYPSADLSILPNANRYEDVKPTSIEEYQTLLRPVKSMLQDGLYLPPGTCLGPVCGEASGRIPGWCWIFDWHLFAERRSIEHLVAAGVRFSAVVDSQVHHMSDPDIHLVELEAHPTAMMAAEAFEDGIGAVCPVCEAQYPRLTSPVLRESTIPHDVDLFTCRNASGYLFVTERLMQAVMDLGLSNMVFHEVQVMG